ALSVAGEREASDVGRGERLRLGRAERLAGGLIDRDLPEGHRSAAVAQEPQELSVGRPHGVSVDGPILGHGDRLFYGGKALQRNRPDVALAAVVRETPVGDAKAMRRDARLHGVAGEETLRGARRDVGRPELAGDRAAVGGPADLRRVDEALPV